MKKFYRSHFLGLEFCFSLILIILVVFVSFRYVGIENLQTNLNGTRGTLYGTLAALAGAMLGFVITGLSVLLTTNSTEQIGMLKKSKHYKTIFKIFFSTSKYLGLLLIISLISLVFDKDDKPIMVLTTVTVWLSILVGLRLLRCIWVLEKIVSLHILNK